MIIRNQISSDGTLRTWKFRATAAGLPIPDSMEYSERVIPITEEKREKLQRCEERIKIADLKIRTPVL